MHGMPPGYDPQLLLDGNLSYSDNNNTVMQQYKSVASAKEEIMEAEIRRLEELNRIDAQRFREPLTTDEESPSYHHLQQEAELRRLQEESHVPPHL